MKDRPLHQATTSVPSRSCRGRGIWTAFALVVAAVVTFLAVLLPQPIPSAPPAPKIAGILAQILVPGVGLAWVELGEERPDRTRPALAVRSIHPTFRIFPDYERQGRVWWVYRVHESDSQEKDAVMTWNGRTFSHLRISGNTNGVVLIPEPVARLRSIETKSGIQFWNRGVAIEWSSSRPEWMVTSPLDRKVQQDSDDLDAKSWTDFFGSVSAMLGNRPGLALFKADSMSGTWPCELWQVVYHRSPKAVSVLHGQYQYLGGAHGQRRVSHSNFIDGADGIERLDFASLFAHPRDWQEEVNRLLMKELRRQGASWAQAEDPTKTPQEVEGLALKLEEQELASLKFTASSEGVFVHFDEYEAGSYAEGDYVVLLPWTSLAPWVRSDVVEAFTTTPALPDSALNFPRSPSGGIEVGR